MRDKLFGNKNIKTGESGQLLIEAMIAISVITVGLLGIFSLLSQSLGFNKVASNQYVGSYLAAEGIEVVKNIIDTNAYRGGVAWNNGVVGTYALQYDTTSLSLSVTPDTPLKFDSTVGSPTFGTYNYAIGVPTNFKRSVTITSPLPGDELQVTSTVTWTDRGGLQQQVVLEDHFMNWR